MYRNERGLRWSVVACALVLVACASSAPKKPDASRPTGSQPGSEEFGLTTEQLASRIDTVEGAIRRCMTSAGFEYVPVDFATIKAAMGSDKTKLGVSDPDFIAQFGYGISTRLGEPDPVVLNGKGEQNVTIYAALAPNDKISYDRSLHGENPNATFARALESEDLSGTGGCTRTAIEQNFAPAELVATYVNPVDARIASDKRMIDALAKWSKCVRAAGYEYDQPDDGPVDIANRLAGILKGQDPKTLTGPALDALTQLQGYERAVAVTAHKCVTDLVEPVVAQIESEIFGAPQQ